MYSCEKKIKANRWVLVWYDIQLARTIDLDLPDMSDENNSLYLVFVGVIFSQHLRLLLGQLGQHVGLLLEQLGQ
jgi:hypothetical protein